MATISGLEIASADTRATTALLKELGVDDRLEARPAQDHLDPHGFRGFTLSLVTSQPGDADRLAEVLGSHGATEIKPMRKSFWGYGGVFRSADGLVWKVACSTKKDSRPVSAAIEDVVLLVGATDVRASKEFFSSHGFGVRKSYGSKYVELDSGASVTLALYGRKGLAKDAGVPPTDWLAPGVTLVSDAGSFTDPDGFVGRAA